MPTCDQATIDANVHLVLQINSGKNYYEIHVRVISVQTNGILIEADNAKDPTGNNRFMVPWGDPKIVWPTCPSTLPPQTGQPPSPGATGTLYISIDYLQSNGIGIVGTPTKWPKVE